MRFGLSLAFLAVLPATASALECSVKTLPADCRSIAACRMPRYMTEDVGSFSGLEIRREVKKDSPLYGGLNFAVTYSLTNQDGETIEIQVDFECAG